MAGRWLLATGLLFALAGPALCAPLKAYADAHAADLGPQSDDAELRLFIEAYSGLFHNEGQVAAAADPKVTFASKFHVPITLPSVGPMVFYVHEKSSAQGGALRYRLRVASISRLREAEGVVFVAEHYQFADQTPLESLGELEAARQAAHLDPAQVSRVEGGAVQFKRREGEEVWEVQTKYDSCKDTSVNSTTTHISGTLTRKGWSVKATMSRGDAVVFSADLQLDRAAAPSEAPAH